MPRIYNCLTEYGETEPGDADGLSHIPFAVAAVWRYSFPVTFSRQNQNSVDDDEAATKLRDEVLIVCDDIISMAVSSTKNNYTSQLNVELEPSYNYLSEVFPGDWVAAWIVNGESAARTLIQDIREGKTCNEAGRGLKFFGRALAMRKGMVTDPNGVKRTGYGLSAASGLEWTAGVYYEPALESVKKGIATEWMTKTGVAINDLILAQNTAAGGGISTMKAFPRLMDAFFGAGVPKNEGAMATPGSADTTAGLDSADVFLVPTPVAQVLGVSRGTKKSNKVGINDITDVVLGIQRYESLNSEELGEILKPSNARETVDGAFTSVFEETESRRMECDELLGLYLPSPPQFNGQHTVWQILSQFLNDAVNEMYYTLRVGPSGRIMPTLVVRQLPFSSGIISEEFTPKKLVVATRVGLDFSEGKDGDAFTDEVTNNVVGAQTRNIKLTRFAELPRWQVPEILVQSLNIGRNDALRFNFIHVYGSSGEETRNSRAAYISRDHPVKDDLDIARSGLRMYPKTVACSPADTLNRKAGDWMYILSDILMGQHLTLTGTMSCHGIYAPISIGDNVEYDRHIFHLEAITHQFNFDTNSGRRSFRTSLALSHGVRAEQMTGEDLSLYAGIDNKDLTRNEGAISGDLSKSPTPASKPESFDSTLKPFLKEIKGE